jgi:dihydroorotate dehydrogenase (NAD+) catalytic subunit
MTPYAPRSDVIVEFLLAGAVAIGVGTVSFWDLCACEKLVDALERWCLENRVQSIRELIGGLVEPS